MNEDHKKFLTENCNRLLHGECHNLGCMRRGGHKKGDTVDYDKATCSAFEIFNILKEQDGV